MHLYKMINTTHNQMDNETAQTCVKTTPDVEPITRNSHKVWIRLGIKISLLLFWVAFNYFIESVFRSQVLTSSIIIAFLLTARELDQHYGSKKHQENIHS